MAVRPCELHRLPDAPTEGDLEVGYMTRGRQIADCDAARRLAVETLLAERAAADAARRRTFVMALNSVNTNSGAMVALQNLQTTNAELGVVQGR
eukprot:gene44360-biopygen30440